MGQGYSTKRTGAASLNARFRKQQKAADATRTAANIRNSKITGGSGLTIQDSDGQAIQLFVTPDNISAIDFTPPTSLQVLDWAAAINFVANADYGGGDLTLTSVASPIPTNTQPAQTAEVSLTSGDGGSNPAGVNIQAGQIGGVQLNVLAAFSGNPASIRMGQPGTFSGVQEDGTSWRLLGPSSSLVLPNGTAEVRVRDANNANYVPIRASAFTVTSSREAKQDISDLGWSAADAVARAKAQRWRYRPEHADPSRVHFGPMAEDLPAELVDNTDPETPAVNVADLVGVLWGAVGELTARVRDLERQVAEGI